MPPRQDLTGMKFGHLTVIELDVERSKNGKKTHWICECDCADRTRMSVIANNLKRGNTTKCKLCKANNLIGKTFHYLTVIQRVVVNGKIMWKAQCKCGNIITVRGNSLTSGHTRSCGCFHRERVSEDARRDFTGLKVGLLTVTGRSERKDKMGDYYWYCDCECGTKNHEVTGHHLSSQRVLSCGCVKSKGEKKIADILSSHKIPFKAEVKVRDCILSTGGSPRFDFAILKNDGSIGYFIEYQGEQHFRARGPIFTEERVQKIQQRDSEKLLYCQQNRIPIIYINYTDYRKLDLSSIYFPELLQ